MPDDGTEEFSFPADINTEISSEHIFVPKGTSMHDVEHALKAELGKSLPPSGMPEPPEPIPVKVAEQPVRVILEPGEAPFEPTEAVVKEALQTVDMRAPFRGALSFEIKGNLVKIAYPLELFELNNISGLFLC